MENKIKFKSKKLTFLSNTWNTTNSQVVDFPYLIRMFRVTSMAKQVASILLILTDFANFGRKLAYFQLIPLLWNMNVLRQKHTQFLYFALWNKGSTKCFLNPPEYFIIAIYFKYYKSSYIISKCLSIPSN